MSSTELTVPKRIEIDPPAPETLEQPRNPSFAATFLSMAASAARARSAARTFVSTTRRTARPYSPTGDPSSPSPASTSPAWTVSTITPPSSSRSQKSSAASPTSQSITGAPGCCSTVSRSPAITFATLALPPKLPGPKPLSKTPISAPSHRSKKAVSSPKASSIACPPSSAKTPTQTSAVYWKSRPNPRRSKL